MPKVLATYPFLNLLLHAGPHPAMETEWLGFANSADFRAALLEALRLAHLHKVAGWVADDRRLGPVRPKDLEWTYQQVLKPLSDLGVRRFAHLESDEALNRLTIDGLYRQVVPSLAYEYRHFTDLEPARAWALGALPG